MSEEFRDSDRRPVPFETAPVVRVLRDREGTRVLRFDYDAGVVAAIKGCKDGRVFAKWDADAKSWAVPRDIWPCVNETLVAAGYEIQERAA